jgi:undecaprenyl diphosphate synthase
VSEADRAEAPDPTARSKVVVFEGTEVRVPESLPRHIAFIMDGNGRWARARGLARIRGHERGAEALRRVTRFCRSIGVEEVTFFALSTENFRKRPKYEVRVLMRLLRSYLVSERQELLDNGIQLRAIGRTRELPEAVRAALRKTLELTAGQKDMILRLALNYGGRQEVLDALARAVRDGGRAEEDGGPASSADDARLTEEGFRRYLYDPEMSDPDLLVRSAGELRLSNFLLWQCSYSEIWVTRSLWPDFDVLELAKALADFSSRERKYGALRLADDSAWQDDTA